MHRIEFSVAITTGTLIRGYNIQDKIGEGGMTTVFRAERQSDHLILALKHLHPHIAFDSRMIERFARGAEIMMELHHPNIATVYEYFREGDNYFQAEEYLRGGSLADYLDANNGPVDEKKALSWCRQALLAIDHAHQHGVLHRDLKPGNLMLDSEGSVKVTDFGIAKVLGSSRVTVTGAQLGTPAYMSPEQVQDPVRVTHLTDVYSMGVVLFELLTGRPPFGGGGGDSSSDFETRRAVVQDSPPRPRTMNPAISRDLERLVLRAMEKDPSDRYGGGAEFAAAIDRYLGSKRRSWVWPPRLRRRQIASVGAGALIFGLGLWIGALRKATPSQQMLVTKHGTSVRVDESGGGDSVSISRDNDNNLISVDLGHSRVAIVGFPGVDIDDLRPHDPLVEKGCQELQYAKGVLDAAVTASGGAKEALTRANEEDPGQPKGRPSEAQKTAADEVTRTDQEQAQAERDFLNAAQKWLNLKSKQPCLPQQ